MNWRQIDRDVVLLARLAAIAIIIAGIIVAALDASVVPLGMGAGSHYKLRTFSHQVLSYLWDGGLLLAAAEIADRYRWGIARGRIDWNGVTLIKLLGAAVVVVGIATTVWDVTAFDHATASPLSRFFLRNAIQYAFQGLLLVVLAEIAQRFGADSAPGERATSEEPPATPSMS